MRRAQCLLTLPFWRGQSCSYLLLLWPLVRKGLSSFTFSESRENIRNVSFQNWNNNKKITSFQAHCLKMSFVIWHNKWWVFMCLCPINKNRLECFTIIPWPESLLKDRNKVTLKKTIASLTCLRQWGVKWKAVSDTELVKRQSILPLLQCFLRKKLLSVYIF